MWRRASLSLLRSSLRHHAGALPHGASDVRVLFSSAAFRSTFPLFSSESGMTVDLRSLFVRFGSIRFADEDFVSLGF